MFSTDCCGFSAPDFFYRLSCVYGRFKSEVVESKTKEGDTEWKQTVDILVTEPDLEYLKVREAVVHN